MEPSVAASASTELVALVLGVLAALGGIVKMFLTRMEKSQQMGHEIATGLTADNKAALQIVVENHEKVMTTVTTRFEKAIDRQAAEQSTLAHDVRELCTVIRSKIPDSFDE